MKDHDLKQASAREDLCRYLAACYYQPAQEFADEKLFDSMLAAASCVHPDLAVHARRLGEEFAVEGVETLLIDYTRLFLGPTHTLARPYGSVWLEGENVVMGESTMATLALYREGGFDIGEEFREPPDHIAAELEFLYLLLYRENEAQREGKQGVLEAKAALRHRFLDEHLGRWIGPFTAAVKAGAQTSFYRHLAELTHRFVGMQLVKAQGT